ncbi:MAG: extracellular solute-binding protein [Alkalispirochaeta sp.]
MHKVVLSVLAVLVLVSGMAFAAGAGESASEEEDRLVIYASHPTEMVDYFVEAFQAKYGEVEVELITGGTGELLSRVQAERDRPQGDIMWGGGSHTGGSAPDLFAKYESPALDGISEEFHDPEGYNAPFDAFTMVIVYNTDLVSEDEVPRRWADLADPKWSGQVVHANPAASSSAYAAMNTWLQIGGWDMVEELAENQIIADSSSAPFTQVGQGENPLGVAYEEGAFRWVPSGNVGIVYPEDGVALLPGGLFLIQDGPNPSNAQRFADFVLSKESQEALAREFPGRRPTHREVELHPAMTPVEELNVIEYPVEAASENREEYLNRWREIMIRTR